MTANSRSLRGRAARLGAVAAVSMGLIAGAVAAPATAASTSNGGNGKTPAAAAKSVKYTALGDSFAAGSGAGNEESGPCLRSPQAYSLVDAAALGVQLRGNLGCFGATTADIRTTQVPLMSPATDVATLTVGGNDVGSGRVTASCLPDPATPACQDALQSAGVSMGTLPAKLTAVIAAIRGQAKHASIIVAGYPHLFEPANMAALGYPASLVQASAIVNAATDQLNAVLAGTAAANGATFVDVAGTFAGHGYPSAAQWINFDPATPGYFGNLHPNALGQSLGYAAALKAAIGAG